MSDKLQVILEEIKLGKRNNINDITFSVEEYLSKDSNQISFLEYLLKNKIEVNFFDQKKLENNVEAAYIFCKCKFPLYFFELDEQNLFENIDGKPLIEHIIINNKLSQCLPRIIKSVKNNIKIVDILIYNKSIKDLDYLNPQIVDKLMKKYKNGLYPIEKYINNEKIFNHLLPLISDAKKLLQLFYKYKDYKLLLGANEKILMYKLNDGNTILYYLLKNNLEPYILYNIPPNIEFINLLRENDLYKYLTRASEKVLISKIDSNKTLLEDIIEKGYDNDLKNNIYIQNEDEILEVLYKMDRLDIASEISDEILLTSAQIIFNDNSLLDVTVLEFLLDKGYNPVANCNTISDEDIIRILYNRGYLYLLGKKITEDEFFIEVEDGILLIDKLLENQVDIECDFSYVETAKKLYDYNRIDLLVQVDVDVLLKNCSTNSSFLDYILECIKNNKIKYNLNDFDLKFCSLNTVANFYITIAKHGMINYIDALSEDELLKKVNGTTLLEELLDINSDLTINTILSNEVKSKIKIAIILKSRGFKQNSVDIPLGQDNFAKEYLDDIQSHIGIGPLSLEGVYLLEKIEKLFISDKKSNLELVSALIKGYRQALIINYDVTIQELRNLVKIKEQNLDKYIYVKEKDSGYFNETKGSVHCDDNTISTLLHETGHALHYYLTNDKIPEEYSDIVERIKQNLQTLCKVEIYSEEINTIKQQTKEKVVRKYKEFCDEYFNSKKDNEILSFLKKSKEEQKEEFKNLGIADEVLNIILNNIFTLTNFIQTQKRIFISENVDATMRSEFGALIVIGDILDAIYDGHLHDGTLKNNRGIPIKSTYGHGVSYYSDESHGFVEMIANFCTIIKLEDSRKTLDLLKDIVGEELYIMLSQFYYNNIVESKESSLENINILGGLK